jgi:ketosteroid isomerase-like protein
MTLEELEKRVQVLEDLEEIKKLKVRYAKYADDNYNAEKLGELFTEDAVWAGKAWGEFRGREAIKEYFDGASKNIIFACHRIVAPDITVEGNKAYGTWYGMTTGILHNGKGFWSSCLYTDEYARIDGKWLMSSVEMSHFYQSPYEGGWAKEKHMSLKAEDQG